MQARCWASARCLGQPLSFGAAPKIREVRQSQGDAGCAEEDAQQANASLPMPPRSGPGRPLDDKVRVGYKSLRCMPLISGNAACSSTAGSAREPRGRMRPAHANRCTVAPGTVQGTGLMARSSCPCDGIPCLAGRSVIVLAWSSSQPSYALDRAFRPFRVPGKGLVAVSQVGINCDGLYPHSADPVFRFRSCCVLVACASLPSTRSTRPVPAWLRSNTRQCCRGGVERRRRPRRRQVGMTTPIPGSRLARFGVGVDRRQR